MNAVVLITRTEELRQEVLSRNEVFAVVLITRTEELGQEVLSRNECSSSNNKNRGTKTRSSE